VATQIKETPVLKGKAARRFEAIIADSANKKISQQERDRIMSVYRSVKIVDKRDILTT
jgi:hypothetical protein